MRILYILKTTYNLGSYTPTNHAENMFNSVYYFDYKKMVNFPTKIILKFKLSLISYMSIDWNSSYHLPPSWCALFYWTLPSIDRWKAGPQSRTRSMAPVNTRGRPSRYPWWQIPRSIPCCFFPAKIWCDIHRCTQCYAPPKC